ncbi:glycosyltransferase [Thermonema rossianum]|uniref:glycosyltransferase n=1 Tax=Thermonema rossianum TaxID=55505 RepID=UPI00056E9930|nr:glycosyltransferase [Thermonema rossianum]
MSVDAFQEVPFFSIIIPVYNRPEELDELLASLCGQSFRSFEVIVVEDGSEKDCRKIVQLYQEQLPIQYIYKQNSGPSASRNRGAQDARGDYLLFLDSDCLTPPHFLKAIYDFLQKEKAACFGGPDTAHPGFSPIQKAINYAMTSRLTTGGIRGGKHFNPYRFLPRSFNMGVQKKVFQEVKGFAEDMRFGEDIDLSLRIRAHGYPTVLIPEAWVYHKRRTKLWQFFKQIYNSGMARVYLSERHPGTLKLIHLLPSCFVLFVAASLLLALVSPFALLPLLFWALLIFMDALVNYRYPLRVALTAVAAAFLQLTAYGIGFLHAWVRRKLLRLPQKHAFVKRFYE